MATGGSRRCWRRRGGDVGRRRRRRGGDWEEARRRGGAAKGSEGETEGEGEGGNGGEASPGHTAMISSKPGARLGRARRCGSMEPPDGGVSNWSVVLVAGGWRGSLTAEYGQEEGEAGREWEET
ncbi:hypothetical protein NL676_036121 [Syzygium grande]|nr:hypothetical protein NL676_036121 [Syzygium grande]